MNRRLRPITGLFATVIAILVAGRIALAADGPKTLFTEPFRAPLDSSWSWLREDSSGWKIENGALLLQALSGHLYKHHNDARNVLLRKPPQTARPLAIEVQIENQPETLFEEATLHWYYDDDNYIGLFKERLQNDVHLRMFREVNGNATPLYDKQYEGASAWLRLVIDRGKATGYFRASESDPWQRMAEAPLLADRAANIGLNASGAARGAARWAKFREFRILELAE